MLFPHQIRFIDHLTDTFIPPNLRDSDNPDIAIFKTMIRESIEQFVELNGLPEDKGPEGHWGYNLMLHVDRDMPQIVKMMQPAQGGIQ